MMPCRRAQRTSTASGTTPELTKQEVIEIDRPDAVGALFEADVFMLKSSAHEQLPSVEANGPRGTDEPNEVMAWILGGAQQRARILSTGSSHRRHPSGNPPAAAPAPRWSLSG